MDTWTTLTLSRQTTCELRRAAASHRLARTAVAASARTRRDPSGLRSAP